MFQQIVVPLDGSEQAEHALAVAARIARRTEGAVTLMQVVGAEVARGSDAMPVRTGEREAPGSHRPAVEYLERVRLLPELAGVPTSVVVRDGDPVAWIVAEARRCGADLIVLSHRRHGAAASFFTGSVADRLMRRSHIPVLVIHAGSVTEFRAEQAQRSTRQPVQALVPLDGSPLAEMAIPYALEMLRVLEDGQGAHLHLAYVMDPKRAYRSGVPETTAMRDARTYLKSVTDRITADPSWRSIAVTSKVEPDANVAMGIERVAEQGASLRGDTFDFVAMATHGREGVARWLAGSVTEALVHDVHVPVLVLHPRLDSAAAGGEADADEIMRQAPWPALF